MNQEVVDGLVEAVEKKDVLYVLVYLDDMREQGWLEQGVNTKHSKTYNTALEAMAQFLPTRQHKPHLILHLLLLSGASYSPDEHWDGGGNQAHESLLSALEHWELFGKDQAMYAQLLIALGPVAACDWIDGLFPEPHTISPDSSAPAVATNCTTLGLVLFPQGYSKGKLNLLFHQNRIPLRILLYDSTTVETYAFVDVESGEAAEKCFEALDGLRLEGRKLRIFPSRDLTEPVLARLGIHPSLKSMHLVSPPKSLLKPIKPHSPQKSFERKSYALLIFGLPLQTARSFFEPYHYSTCILRQSRLHRRSVAALTFAKKTASEDVLKAYTALCEGKGGYQGTLVEPDKVTEVIEDWRNGKGSFSTTKKLSSARPAPPKRSRSDQSREESPDHSSDPPSNQSSDESSSSESDSPPPSKRPHRKRIRPPKSSGFSTSPPLYSSYSSYPSRLHPPPHNYDALPYDGVPSAPSDYSDRRRPSISSVESSHERTLKLKQYRERRAGLTEDLERLQRQEQTILARLRS